MSKIDGEYQSATESGSPDRLYIPSNVASRIGSPIKNFIELANSEGFQFSFADGTTEVDLNKISIHGCLQDLQNQSQQSLIMKELEFLRMQVIRILIAI